MPTYAQAQRPRTYSSRRSWPPRRRRDPGWARVCLILGLLIAVGSGLFVGGSKAFDWYASGKVKTEHLIQEPQGKDISGPINILLLGMDERANSTDLIHTDSVIIVHVNAKHSAVSLVSLPRDSLVSAPAFAPSDFPGMSQLKLTEVFSYGNRTRSSNGGWIGDNSTAGRARGVQLLTSVIKSLVPGGITFNAVAIINYAGFRKLVDAMGGVSMCVDENTWSEHFNRDGKYVGETYGNRSVAKEYKVGCQHLLPWEALDYVRQRHYLANGDGDYGRQRHQQQFLAAVFKQLLSRNTLTDPKRLTGLIGAAGDLLTLDLGGNAVLDWIFTLRNIRGNDVTMIKTNAGKYASQRVNNVSFEIITPTMIELLKAVHDDKIDQFLAAHPDWIAPSSSQ
jgi:LCP family protein required for cell wall assembly